MTFPAKNFSGATGLKFFHQKCQNGKNRGTSKLIDKNRKSHYPEQGTSY